METRYTITCSSGQAQLIKQILRLFTLTRCGDMTALQDLLGLSTCESTDAILTLIKKEMWNNNVSKNDVYSLTDKEKVGETIRQIADIERPIAQAIWDEGRPGVPQIKLDPELPDQLSNWEPLIKVTVEQI